MKKITSKIVNHCKNNDYYNFKDSVNSVDEFTKQVEYLILFNPIDIIDYLSVDKLELCKDEKNQVNNIINDINNTSYELLINGFLDTLKSYKPKDINIIQRELLEKKLYKRFISLSLAAIILDSLYIRKDINIKDNQLLTGYIVTEFNNMQVGNRSILSIMDQLHNNKTFNYSYDELTSATNKVRNNLNNFKGVK